MNTPHSNDPTTKRKAMNIRTIRTPLARVWARPALALLRFEGCDWPVPTCVCVVSNPPVVQNGLPFDVESLLHYWINFNTACAPTTPIR